MEVAAEGRGDRGADDAALVVDAKTGPQRSVDTVQGTLWKSHALVVLQQSQAVRRLVFLEGEAAGAVVHWNRSAAAVDADTACTAQGRRTRGSTADGVDGGGGWAWAGGRLQSMDDIEENPQRLRLWRVDKKGGLLGVERREQAVSEHEKPSAVV